MKIDTTKIENYAEMTAEEKLAALEAFEFDAPEQKESDEVTKLKAALSRANSDAAEWKRQFREKQSESERAEAERAERDAAREEELKTLRREKSVSGYLANYLALGYEKTLAQRAAEATADGNAAEIMNCQQEFLEAKKKELEAAALNKQPGLSAGAPLTTADVDKAETNKLRRYAGLPPI